MRPHYMELTFALWTTTSPATHEQDPRYLLAFLQTFRWWYDEDKHVIPCYFIFVLLFLCLLSTISP
jgi:hypothetical protein